MSHLSAWIFSRNISHKHSCKCNLGTIPMISWGNYLIWHMMSADGNFVDMLLLNFTLTSEINLKKSLIPPLFKNYYNKRDNVNWCAGLTIWTLFLFEDLPSVQVMKLSWRACCIIKPFNLFASSLFIRGGLNLCRIYMQIDWVGLLQLSYK